ncbi:NADH dehydrogenase [Virgibacillus pantothenticus]|uniref:CoA-disulfide reductase n=1 Tax=Virgibacillus pantothenticus TaxID=1473 RepID=UPI001B225610|nr:CoA-disulfide reductase [Virgibacillus pantothenticus]GIP64811.1 NADH dehydrogenase [Virgibacillus pantothenticus]
MTQKILIVGGVGGGATVAAQIRRKNKDATIIIFDKDEYIAFSNCGMPYYLGNTVKDREQILYPKEEFAVKYGVQVRTKAEVTAIHREQKAITYLTESKQYTETYDQLILSPGATAVMPPIPGMDQTRTFSLHTIADMDEIAAYIEEQHPKSAAIVGGGFIGLEMLENLHAKELNCTLIDRSDQVMNPLDQDMAETVHEYINEKQVHLLLNNGLKEFSNEGKTLHVASGKTVAADMTIMAVGIQPNVQLAQEAGLSIGKTGAIIVNEYMQTDDPAIYALGDAVETTDWITGEPRNIALAWPAHRQAFIIASHLHGQPIPYQGTIGSSILRLFEITIGATGANRIELEAKGIPYKEAKIETLSNANYFPSTAKLWIKILFDAHNGRIYGGQAVGYAGADKRLAILSTAIKGRMTVFDLPELELAYAPPYSSPKDPVNILGYKATSMLAN